jgi:hypothetical protein
LSGQVRLVIEDISGWLTPLGYGKDAIGAALLEVFDNLYTRPLFGWRAFLRSALFTIAISTVFLLEFYSDLVIPGRSEGVDSYGSLWRNIFFPLLVTNIISDYASLFVVRRMLIVGRRTPLLALLLSPLMGMVVILSLFYVRDFLLDHFSLFTANLRSNIITWLMSFFSDRILMSRNIVLPALLVHLWLRLFAACIVLMKVLDGLLWTTARAQWFLKRGKDHPLDAIGYVAATLVFIGTYAARLLE